uniref:ATP synthase complex subunit 8 n=1 Tax=Tympanogaster modulatrix TaxID=2107386 RepID=A0A7H0DL90_9COLE|nr:ATP synthase F0 subunit 8 [Tympanogaster modulatrix]
MPQMAPMNWLMLFLYFTLIFMIFNSMNYFSFKYKILSKNFFKKNNFINWKW